MKFFGALVLGMACTVAAAACPEKDPAKQYDAGVKLLEQQDYEQAKACFQAAAAADPKNPAALLRLGDIYLRVRQVVEANEAYRKAIELDPKNPYPHERLADMYDRINATDMAIVEYKALVELKPADAEAHFMLGAIYDRVGQAESSYLELAVPQFQEAVRLSPNDSKAHFYLAKTSLSLGKVEEAIAAAMQAVRLEPANGAYLQKLGRAYEQKGRYGTAAEQFAAAAKAAPTVPQFHNDLARVNFVLERFKEAIAAYTESLKLDPQDGEIEVKLGVALRMMGDFDGAMKHFERALAIDENNRNAHLALAFWYALEDRGRQAVAELEKVYPPGSTDPEGFVYRGQIENEIGRYDKAIENYKRAIELHPDSMGLYGNLGIAYQMAGNYPKALEQYDKAASLSKEKVEYRALLRRWHLLSEIGMLKADDAFYAGVRDLFDYYSAEKNRGIETSGRLSILLRILINVGARDAAVKYFVAAIENREFGYSSDFMTVRAELARVSGSIPSVVNDAAEEAFVRNRDNPDANRLIMRIRLDGGQYAAATRAFAKSYKKIHFKLLAARIDADLAEEDKEKTQARVKRYLEGIDGFLKQIESSPVRTDALLLKGLLEIYLHQSIAAVKALREATHLSPETPLTYVLLTRAYADMGATKLADAAFARYRALAPELAIPLVAEESR